MPGDQPRGRLAGMADAERVDQPVERDAPLLGDGGEEVAGRLLAPAVAGAQVRPVPRLQREDVGRLADPALGEEGLDRLGAQSLDVEGAAADEMPELLHRLRRADQVAGAIVHRLARLAHHVRAADRAGLREQVRTATGRAAGEVDVLDLRDHVAGAVDLHPVARPGCRARRGSGCPWNRAPRCSRRCAAWRSAPRRPPR